jgi:hypothetical protein
MDGSESTAIVDLLEQLANKPVAQDSAPDLFASAPVPDDPVPSIPPKAEVGSVLALHLRQVRALLSQRRVWSLFAAAAVVGGLVGIRLARHGGHTPRIEASVLAASVDPSSWKPNGPQAPGPSRAAIAHKPALVEVRFDSQPGGASVSLIAGSRSSPLGTTPLTVSLDASHSYDVLLALAGHASKLVHFDPRATPKLLVPFDTTPAPTPGVPRAAVATRAPTAAPAPPPHRPRRARTRVASRDDNGVGVLTIASKPPCEITIDGTPTGLVTPQRSIDLSAGIHRVTLTNSSLHVAQTLSVRVTANASTKVVRNLIK